MRTMPFDDEVKQVIALRRAGKQLKEIAFQMSLSIEGVAYRIARYAPELVATRGNPGLSAIAAPKEDSIERYWKIPKPRAWQPPVTGSAFIRPLPLSKLMGARA